jgi:hypothetical protein
MPNSQFVVFDGKWHLGKRAVAFEGVLSIAHGILRRVDRTSLLLHGAETNGRSSGALLFGKLVVAVVVAAAAAFGGLVYVKREKESVV